MAVQEKAFRIPSSRSYKITCKLNVQIENKMEKQDIWGIFFLLICILPKCTLENSQTIQTRSVSEYS